MFAFPNPHVPADEDWHGALNPDCKGAIVNGYAHPEVLAETDWVNRNEPQPWQQLVRRPTTAGSGAEPKARRAIRRDAGDRGLHPDQEHDEEAPRSFLLILLRALGAMYP